MDLKERQDDKREEVDVNVEKGEDEVEGMREDVEVLLAVQVPTEEVRLKEVSFCPCLFSKRIYVRNPLCVVK